MNDAGAAPSASADVETLRAGAKIMHILVRMYTKSELQETAFEFVRLRKDLGNDEPDELQDKAKEALLWKWQQYIQITEGVVKMNELPEGFDDDSRSFPEEDELPAPCGAPSLLPLRITQCVYEEGLRTGWRGLIDRPVAYPFGHGLFDLGQSPAWSLSPLNPSAAALSAAMAFSCCCAFFCRTSAVIFSLVVPAFFSCHNVKR